MIVDQAPQGKHVEEDCNQKQHHYPIQEREAIKSDIEAQSEK